MMMWYGVTCFVAGLTIGVWAHSWLARDPYPDQPIRYRPEELFDDEGRKYYESGYDERDGGEWV